MERVLAAEVLGRQRLAGELRRAMEDAIERLSLPGVRTDDNGHGTLVVHGLQRQERDDVPDSAESSSEGEWCEPKRSRVGDAYQVGVPPMGTESAERKDRLILLEQQISAGEDRKPESLYCRAVQGSPAEEPSQSLRARSQVAPSPHKQEPCIVNKVVL